jgi:hypothetical protein
LAAISPAATAEEVAAIVAALAAVTGTETEPETLPTGTLSEWVRGTRLGARRAGLQRGPWRLSGRIGRRARA